MKKIMSVVFALILVSAMSISAFAEGSPVAPINKTFEGGKVTYSQNAGGTEFTFTAEKKDGYNFTGWTIDTTKFDIVSGSLTSETIVVKPLAGANLETASNTVVPNFEKIPVTVTTSTTAATTADTTDADDKDTTKKTTKKSNKTTTKAEKETTTAAPNNSSSSPKTGDSMAMVAFAAAALAGVVISKKKLSK